MKSFSIAMLLVGGIALAASLAFSSGAMAQSGNDTQATPKNWNYEIKDGKRVPKAQRVTNADGSWREEIRQGNCVTVKEGSPQGEVKITRKCD
ncbi:MAG TPA: hypothetical protein VNH53_02505 [Sphingomicrobium sp.]|jgi:hypothetical protein|nr:hypothetical protein [Sphingomicrobium sp.]